MAALKWTVSTSRRERAPSCAERCAGWKSGVGVGKLCRPMQTRSEPALLRRREDVGMARLERTRALHERRAKFRTEGHGHIVAAVVIAGIIVILGAFSLRADNELLQYRIPIVHGPNQVAQARSGCRNMNATHALSCRSAKIASRISLLDIALKASRFPASG